MEPTIFWVVRHEVYKTLIPMGDWSRSEMMCSHRYEKKRVRTKGPERDVSALAYVTLQKMKVFC